MSTFRGPILEYEGISIDRFDGINIMSTAFFLSHCHKDHMQGLAGKAFLSRLRSRPDIKLYVSETSRNLLLNQPKFSHLQRHTVSLALDWPHTLTVPTDGAGRPDYDVVVTLVNAQHCLGSVMLLFEGGPRGSVLYTGDFRLSVGETATLTALHEHSGGAVKELRCTYVDTTLCLPEAAYVPSREDSITALLGLVGPRLGAGGCLRLQLPGAQLGYEDLFEALWRRFAMRVHVTAAQLGRYSGINDVQRTLTTEASSTRLHAGCGCELRGFRCVTVKPSAMWFAHRVGPCRLLEKIGEDVFRLCYSTHASLAEVRDMLQYLKPHSVYPNVRVPGLDVISLISPEKKEEQEQSSELTWNFWGSDDKCETMEESQGTTLTHFPGLVARQLKQSRRLLRVVPFSPRNSTRECSLNSVTR